MKILHIINSLETGGAQKLLADMLSQMSQFKGIEIAVAVFKITDSDNERILKESGINIINIDAHAMSLKSFLRLIPIMRGVDIVHAHLFAANYITAIANIFAKKPLIFTEHSTHNKRRDHRWLKPIEKFVYSRFDTIICISDQTAQSLSNWIGSKISQKRITVIPNGIDITKYRDAPQKTPEEMFGRRGIPLLMVSRFVKSKDQPTVIRALRYVNNPEAFLVFVGDGPLKGKCQKLAKETGLSDRVLFLGTRNDVPNIIKASSIGIQASNWEGFGLTAVEMMAGGIPVIASAVEGLKQLVENSGLLFRPNDFMDLAENINELIENGIPSKLITAATSKSESYSIFNTIKSHLRVYTELYQINSSKEK